MTTVIGTYRIPEATKSPRIAPFRLDKSVLSEAGRDIKLPDVFTSLNVALNNRRPPMASGDLLKLERRQKYYLADAFIDPAASLVLKALDKETSIRWDDLPKFVGLPWPEICRGVTALANAGLCESGTLRVRISELGDRILSEQRNK